MDGTHFDVVVVGSGFSGSVMAYQLAFARRYTSCAHFEGQ
jgi:choline dehydrogenase-like flavoprotein